MLENISIHQGSRNFQVIIQTTDPFLQQISMNVQKALTHVILMLTVLTQLTVITAHVKLVTMEMEAYVVSTYAFNIHVCMCIMSYFMFLNDYQYAFLYLPTL